MGDGDHESIGSMARDGEEEVRERLRRRLKQTRPMSEEGLDDAVFHRVEAEVMRRHEAELGGRAPGDADPIELARHLRWWSKQRPAGEIDYADHENVAMHALAFHAHRRIFQRVDALPADVRRRVLEDAFADGAPSSSSQA